MGVFTGTSGPDTLTGTNFADTITGLAGDDTLDGLEGVDVIRGGDGDDLILGFSGNDRLFGDAGDDLIVGEEGADIIEGGADADVIAGNTFQVITGSLSIIVDTYRDQLVGGAGDDLLLGDHLDVFNGGDGDDYTFVRFGDLASAVTVDLSVMDSGGIVALPGGGSIQNVEGVSITFGWTGGEGGVGIGSISSKSPPAMAMTCLSEQPARTPTRQAAATTRLITPPQAEA